MQTLDFVIAAGFERKDKEIFFAASLVRENGGSYEDWILLAQIIYEICGEAYDIFFRELCVVAPLLASPEEEYVMTNEIRQRALEEVRKFGESAHEIKGIEIGYGLFGEKSKLKELFDYIGSKLIHHEIQTLIIKLNEDFSNEKPKERKKRGYQGVENLIRRFDVEISKKRRSKWPEMKMSFAEQIFRRSGDKDQFYPTGNRLVCSMLYLVGAKRSEDSLRVQVGRYLSPKRKNRT